AAPDLIGRGGLGETRKVPRIGSDTRLHRSPKGTPVGVARGSLNVPGGAGARDDGWHEERGCGRGGRGRPCGSAGGGSRRARRRATRSWSTGPHSDPGGARLPGEARARAAAPGRRGGAHGSPDRETVTDRGVREGLCAVDP